MAVIPEASVVGAWRPSSRSITPSSTSRSHGADSPVATSSQEAPRIRSGPAGNAHDPFPGVPLAAPLPRSACVEADAGAGEPLPAPSPRSMSSPGGTTVV